MLTAPPKDLAERTFLFACAVVRFCRRLSGEPGVVRQIAWQLADAGTSVAANYEEAKGSYSRREFAAKTAIVLKEARESRLWLRIILRANLRRMRKHVLFTTKRTNSSESSQQAFERSVNHRHWPRP